MKLKYVAIFLVLLCCIMGAASATEDVSTDVVSDSVDDVVVDAVDDEISDSSSIDQTGLTVSEDANIEEINEDMQTDILGSNSGNDVLSDYEEHAVIYVNGSSTNDYTEDDIDGQNWDKAWGSPDALPRTNFYILDNGVIYVADGQYTFEDYETFELDSRNITVIGQGINTIIKQKITSMYTADENSFVKYINLTFYGASLNTNTNFINCTFVNVGLSINDELLRYYNMIPTNFEEYGYSWTRNITFDNCVFKDVTTADALVTLYKYGAVNFNNCTFENIVADSLVYRNDSSYFEEDGISFKDCTFTNCKFNGVVDSLANFDDAIVIEDCNYDDEVAVGTTEVNGHFYVNATKLKVVAVDSAVDISSSEKGVVVITLTDNSSAPIAGATVKYIVNGGDEQTVTTGDDGKATIPGLTGEVTIAVNYEGNESFNGISDSKFFNFTEEPVVPAKVATKITAPKVSAVYNVAKNLVITLTDKDGKALASKKVTVKVGTISKTLTTNANGQVSLNVATLVPKTYTATVKFAGDDGYLASSVNPKVVVSKAKVKLAAKAKTFKVKVKTKKYTVTLKNNKGKVMKKVKLTLKVGKKTYKATTNSKGKATFKITKLTKKGKYTATVKFAGSKYYKALSKKVKITVKK